MPKYAGVGSRIVAIIIDTIILIVIASVITIPFGLSGALFSQMTMGGSMANFLTSGLFSTLGLVNFILWILYFTYFEGTSGQTLGKKAMGIKVVKERGKLTYTDAFIRTILRIIDAIGFYILGLIVVLVSEKKQRIGDLAAHTIVVKT